MAAGQPIGVGLIGCGTIAYWKHLPTLARMPGVRITGMADPETHALTRARERVDAPVFLSLAELLALKSVEAVVIASPTVLHAQHAEAACAAGKHIFIEKPLAHDAASLSIVRRSVQTHALVFAVGYNLRFHPACLEVRKRLASGSIGDIRAIVSEFAEPVPVADMPVWKRDRANGGGVLLDLGSHHLDLYRWFLQDELAQVAADIHSLYCEQDSAFVHGISRRGVEFRGYFSFTSSRAHCLSFHGSSAVLRLDLHTGRISEDRSRAGYGIRRRSVASGSAGLAWRARKLVQPSYDPSHALAMRAFVAAVTNPAQRHADLATANDGIAALQAVLEAEAGGSREGVTS